ncbi:MAG: hypothetical protein HUU46_24345 [Candidatus Hydrogenedentes bacterium]|nr:hypothetical protein [Candidatus Hydrogenedentota bacterium]
MKYYFQCPHCKQDEAFYPVSEQDGGLGCALLVFGGLIPFFLFQRDRFQRVQCADCRLIFSKPPIPYAMTARVAVVLMILIGALPLFFFYIQNQPDYDSVFPANDWLLPLEQIVREHPRAAVYSVGGVLAITFVALLGIAIGSNISKRRSMGKMFRLSVNGPTLPDSAAPPASNPASKGP